MKKRIVFLILLSLFFLVALSVSVSAAEIQGVDIGVDINNIQNYNINIFQEESSKEEVILTRYADGNVTSKVYSPLDQSTLSAEHIEAIASSYLPNMDYDSSNNNATVASIMIDVYGRESTEEERVGYLLCGFSTDEDDEIEVYSSSTASLQSYDLVISCAHGVWSPAYLGNQRDGWASTITFYAGRTGAYTYAASASMVSVSISQNYVDYTTYQQNADGSYDVFPAFDYDWSLVQIDEFLGDDLGWYGVQICEDEHEDEVVYTIGYPGDKPAFTQWSSWGVITDFQGDNIVFYSAYICSGNSGGPLLNNLGNLCGIVTFSLHDADDWWVASGGTRMTDSLYNIIMTERIASINRRRSSE